MAYNNTGDAGRVANGRSGMLPGFDATISIMRKTGIYRQNNIS
jgi:hypothetical protein